MGLKPSPSRYALPPEYIINQTYKPVNCRVDANQMVLAFTVSFYEAVRN